MKTKIRFTRPIDVMYEDISCIDDIEEPNVFVPYFKGNEIEVLSCNKLYSGEYNILLQDAGDSKQFWGAVIPKDCFEVVPTSGFM